ncbi:hypothetical protein L6164_025702 [Bauhinia variegata]|uniref:Uncharacterized protein n=1 Tax=Bauhinia variegata TaxID=167791 RepID=A0ACB9M1P9_BAUVA|nr:hypothetical protein L6164_025702 [Bauhinia variegata]
MPMAKSVASFPFFILLVLLTVVVVRGEFGFDCYAYFLGGGCPNTKACLETCRPCYKGVGHVLTWCQRQLDIYTCVCGFKDGAPCPPFDGCRPPTPPSSFSANSNYTFTFNNVTTPLTFGV